MPFLPHLRAPILALALGLTAPLAALAQADHSAHHAPAAAAAPSASAADAPATALPWAEAEVRRINPQAGTISLRHGPIANLDMPPMTMVFQVPERALLQRVQPGHRVRFTAELVNGQYTVRQLEPLQ